MRDRPMTQRGSGPMMRSAFPRVNRMGLTRKFRLIRSNIASAWAMLFHAPTAADDDVVWGQRRTAVREIGAD